MQLEKQKLRKKLALLLEALPEAELACEDKKIFARMVDWQPYHRAQTVFCYVSVGREAGTRLILRHALEKGKAVYVPRCYKGGVMEAARLQSVEELAPAFFGLPEPGPLAGVIAPEKIDLTIVPCVACDAAGVRLGQGGGYYDRYLQSVQGEIVCLGREALLQKHLPQCPHDILMPHVLTGAGFAVGQGKNMNGL